MRGGGGKNKEKKRKNKKEKKRRKKFDTDLMEEEKERVKEAVAESETETSDAGAEAPFTSGLQFSAYSPQPHQAASTYNEKPASYNKPQPPPRRADQILYGLDPQGKPVYMDAADVAELLGTPKAKKAMITFLSGTQESGNPIPSRLQEHFRPPAPRPSLPEWRLERKPAVNEMRRPAQQGRPLKGKAPNMQFFGPSDFVPELPHNVQGGVVKLQGGSRRVGEGGGNFFKSGFPHRSPYQPEQGLPAVQKLEPKPRRRRAADEVDRRMGVGNTKAKGREKKKKSKKGGERRVEKCRACKDETFAASQQEFCKKCDQFFEKKEATKCRHCKRKNFFNRNKEQCQKCLDPISTTTTTSSTTTTVSPARQSLTAAPSLRKKCRSQAFRKKNKDSCKDALDKCRNRMFRAANPRKCEADKTDRAWLAKRCKNKKFLANEKNKKVCQLANIAVTEADLAAEKLDSLEDLVKKCNNPTFKSKNADKCKVVESVDIFAEKENESETKGNEVSEITLSSDKEEPLTGDLIKEEIMETIPIEAFSEEEPKNEINQDEEATSEEGKKKKKRKDKISKS